MHEALDLADRVEQAVRIDGHVARHGPGSGGGGRLAQQLRAAPGDDRVAAQAGGHGATDARGPSGDEDPHPPPSSGTSSSGTKGGASRQMMLAKSDPSLR